MDPQQQQSLQNIPNSTIRRGRFIFPGNVIYELEFDSNLSMTQIKSLIARAARQTIRNRKFRIFSDSEEYTQCEDETFQELFGDQKIVKFTMEIGEAEEFDEAELLLKINQSCDKHVEKFLLCYCLKCGCSCCPLCREGEHKGHPVVDKCDYLVSSRILSAQMFSEWSKDPYKDYFISTDLTELKERLNNILFSQLKKMIEEIQNKCNKIIDYYNNVNKESLRNFQDSIRDVKVSVVKVIDELKETNNIKDIVHNEKIYPILHEKFKLIKENENKELSRNYKNFQDLNKNISHLITNLVNNKYEKILNMLNNDINDTIYEDIRQRIADRFVKPCDQKAIFQRYCGNSNHNSTNSNFNNQGNFSNHSSIKEKENNTLENNDKRDIKMLTNDGQQTNQGNNYYPFSSPNNGNNLYLQEKKNNNNSGNSFLSGNQNNINNFKNLFLHNNNN